jgi:hypothetical protein
MAHELDFSTGQAAIAYTGRVPWHGYGEPMQDNLPLEVWSKCGDRWPASTGTWKRSLFSTGQTMNAA